MTSGRVVFDAWLGPVRRRWVAEMGSAMPGRQFVDRQLEGPFASWEHVHRFVPVDGGRSELLDHVEYHLPAGGLTDSVGAGPADKMLARVFRFRHERTRLDLGRHAEWADQPRLKVAIAGASGLIGSHLADYLTTAGHRRRQAGAQQGGRGRRDPVGPCHRGAVPRGPRGRGCHRQRRGRHALRRLDSGPQEGHPRQPRAVDTHARRGDRPHGLTAIGLHQRVRGGRLRLPRRRGDHRANAPGCRASSPTSAGSGRRRRSRRGTPASAS